VLYTDNYRGRRKLFSIDMGVNGSECQEICFCCTNYVRGTDGDYGCAKFLTAAFSNRFQICEIVPVLFDQRPVLSPKILALAEAATVTIVEINTYVPDEFGMYEVESGCIRSII
jgi:hypothetical protein